MNNHINTQFGFDYSNDDQFFSLIGVEAKLGDDGSDYSYELYNFVTYDDNGKEIGSEYDEDERIAGANGVVEDVGKQKLTLPDEMGKQQKGRIIIAQYEDSDEYDENVFDNHANGEENVEAVNDNLVLGNAEEDNNENKDSVNVKNKIDDNYVNDYDETHEVNSDENNTGFDGTDEENDEDYDEDYDYEGDESEELDENYYDNGVDEEESEEYSENMEDVDDQYEDYDYARVDEKGAYSNVIKNDNDAIFNVLDEKYYNGKSVIERKDKEHEIEDKGTNYSSMVNDELSIGDAEQNFEDDIGIKEDYNYENYDTYNDY